MLPHDRAAFRHSSVAKFRSVLCRTMGESAQLDPRTLVQNYRPIFAIEIETSEISLPGDLIETLSVLL